MSAAPVRALPPPAPIFHKPPFCKFLYPVIDFMMWCRSDTESKIVGTVGMELSKLGARGKAKLSTPMIKDFTNAASEDWITASIAELHTQKILIEEKVPGSKRLRAYSLSAKLNIEDTPPNVFEQCDRCKKIARFETPFAPIPRKGYYNVMAACNPGEWAVFNCIAKHSSRGALHGSEYQPQWQQLDICEIEQDVNRGDTTVSKSLAGLEKMGAIMRFDVTGQASWYRICPEKWENITVRKPLRLVNQPLPKATPKPAGCGAKKQPEKPINPEVPPPVESGIKPIRYCPECRSAGPVTVKSPEELARIEADQDKSPPRVPPRRESKPIIDRNDAAMEVLRSWHDPNRKKTVLKA
jgi:hypothetical protein